MCDPLCIESLGDLNNGTGCCLNSQFNESQTEFLSFEFWSQCGLTTPGNCEPRLTDDPTTSGADSTTSGLDPDADPVTTAAPDANHASTLNAPEKTLGIAVTVFVIIMSLVFPQY